jgi:DNA-binding response OmpR family regulator
VSKYGKYEKIVLNFVLFNPINFSLMYAKYKGKVMLIDDSTTNNLLYENILDSEGYEVFVCDDAKMGLQKLKKEHPDLILLDLMMPRMDGFNFMEKLHEEPDINDIPVIILTAREDRLSEKRAYELGAKDYLIKPVGITEILEKIEKIISHKNNSSKGIS